MSTNMKVAGFALQTSLVASVKFVETDMLKEMIKEAGSEFPNTILNVLNKDYKFRLPFITTDMAVIPNIIKEAVFGPNNKYAAGIGVMVSSFEFDNNDIQLVVPTYIPVPEEVSVDQEKLPENVVTSEDC